MKLSIVTINYNNAEGLRKTLASVASQTYADIEHVIVDGGSTDGSVEIIREYARANGAHGGSPTNNCHQIHWLSEPDNGIYHAMNKGIEIALGQRIVNDDHTSSPITNSKSPITNSQLPITNSQSPIANSQSPISNTPSPIASTSYIQILNSGDILAADDVTERMFKAMGYGQSPIANSPSPIANNQYPIPNHQYPIANSQSPMDNRQWEMGDETNHQYPIANSQSPIANRQYPIANSQSPISNTPSPISNSQSPISIFYGNMIKEWPDGRRVKDTCGGGDYTPESFYYFYRGTLNHDCAYIRKDLFEKYGLYNEQMKICSDWEWYVRAIVLGGEKTVYTNIDVTVFDMTGVSESDGKNRELIKKERREYLESILPAAVLRDYDMLSLPIEQYRRLKKYHLWGIVYFVERILFKLEKWILR